MRILAADIGGTYSRFGLFATGPLRLVASARLSSAAPDFPALLDALTAEHPALAPERADRVVLAVAGPVRGQDRARITNLPWEVDAAAVSARALPGGVPPPVTLLNDFEAQAWACLTPLMDEALPLAWPEMDGETAFAGVAPGPSPGFLFPGPGRNALCAVAGAGTGLGMALLVPDAAAPAGARILPSEGGHAAFPFVDAGERAFGDFVAARKGLPYARGDDVASGPGLTLLHEFLTGQALEAAVLAAAPEFTESATCRMFSRFYARACRNLALTCLPMAGLVLTGGVATRCPALVRGAAFRQEWLNAPGEHKKLLASIPLWHNADPHGGLWGAALAGVAALAERLPEPDAAARGPLHTGVDSSGN